MIVPRNRLLTWVAFIVLPFSVVAGLMPYALPFCLACIGLLFLLAIADLITARAALSGISAQMSPVVRMSKDRPARLEVRISNGSEKRRTVRIGVASPPEIPCEPEDAWVDLPDGSEWSRFYCTCRPVKRGNYHLSGVHLETASRLGFWAVRKKYSFKTEIRVYPNLLADRKDLAAVFLRRGAFGLHAQRQVGKGRDFEQLREYLPGDSFEEVHWKATAKRGRPVTKIFQIERTQELYVVIDSSRLSGRRAAAPVAKKPMPGRWGKTAGPATATPEAVPTVLERFITASLILGLAAEKQGDLFGLISFSDKVDNFIRAKNGKAHYHACRDALYTLEPRIVAPDYDELFTFIRLRLRRRALLIFLTSLDDSLLAENFVRNVDLVRRQHLVLVNMLEPQGVAPVFSNPHITSVDQLYEHLGGHLLWQKLRELETVLGRRGVRFSMLRNEQLSADLVSQYLTVKKRQLL